MLAILKNFCMILLIIIKMASYANFCIISIVLVIKIVIPIPVFMLLIKNADSAPTFAQRSAEMHFLCNAIHIECWSVP